MFEVKNCLTDNVAKVGKKGDRDSKQLLTELGNNEFSFYFKGLSDR